MSPHPFMFPPVPLSVSLGTVMIETTWKPGLELLTVDVRCPDCWKIIYQLFAIADSISDQNGVAVSDPRIVKVCPCGRSHVKPITVRPGYPAPDGIDKRWTCDAPNCGRFLAAVNGLKGRAYRPCCGQERAFTVLHALRCATERRVSVFRS